MHLISCDHCGTVFDAEKLNFPTIDSCYDRDGSVIPGKTNYANGRFIPVTDCPVCHGSIDDPRYG
jgi:hypothetical protein